MQNFASYLPKQPDSPGPSSSSSVFTRLRQESNSTYCIPTLMKQTHNPLTIVTSKIKGHAICACLIHQTQHFLGLTIPHSTNQYMNAPGVIIPMSCTRVFPSPRPTGPPRTPPSQIDAYGEYSRRCPKNLSLQLSDGEHQMAIPYCVSSGFGRFGWIIRVVIDH